MTLLTLAPRALQDLQEIHEYIAEDSRDAADRWIDKLQQSCENLAANPELGRRRGDLGRGLRSYAVGAYVIVYRADLAVTEIARVLHGARDLGSLF